MRKTILTTGAVAVLVGCTTLGTNAAAPELAEVAPTVEPTAQSVTVDDGTEWEQDEPAAQAAEVAPGTTNGTESVPTDAGTVSEPQSADYVDPITGDEWDWEDLDSGEGGPDPEDWENPPASDTTCPDPRFDAADGSGCIPMTEFVLVPCTDESVSDGINCYWDASVRASGHGNDFIYFNGEFYTGGN